MIPRRSSQTTETERLPKNSPVLQERMETIKRSSAEKQQLILTPRFPLETSAGVERDDNFFLL